MNRIILIGNGFDLAHGLKTSYQDFLKWILKQKDYNTEGNIFLEHLYYKQNLNKWIDIEGEYFNILVNYSRKNCLYIPQLNSDFKKVKFLLSTYLNEVSRDLISKINRNIVSQIEQRIYDFIDPSEIVSFENREKFYKDLVVSLGTETTAGSDYFKPKKLIAKRKKYKNKDYYNFLESYKSICSPNNILSVISKLFSSDIPEYFRLPEDILFLNFNYTRTLEKIYKLKYPNINHIHGVTDASMIFGYGDEHSKAYKEIEQLNNDDCLDYIKSISYLNSINYSSLVDFIGYGVYEVLIMGHSCGITDRTLLKMLFEHENCISIRPYYRIYEDKDNKIKDNYSELIKSITRIFNNKVVMRNKVVNKLFCKTLLDYTI